MLANSTEAGAGAIAHEARSTAAPIRRLKLAFRAASLRRSHQCSHRPDCCYVGRRPSATQVFVVEDIGPRTLTHLNYQGAADFDWGCAAPGALELAFSMLADATGRQPTDLVCRAFCEEVVSCLDRAGFVLTDGDVAIWLMTAFIEIDLGAEPRSPRGGGRGMRALAWLRSTVQRMT